MSMGNDKYLEYLEVRTYWRDKFNAQSKDVRHLNVASSLCIQITELELEKCRAKSAYDCHMKKVAEKIVSLKRELIRFDRD